MKVWAAFSGQDIIGMFTEAHRAAEYSAEYNGTTPEDADFMGFDLWQFPPKKATYWVATASVRLSVSVGVHVTLQPSDLWTHQQDIELPADTAFSMHNPYNPRRHSTMTVICDWNPEGLVERAVTWLEELVNMGQQTGVPLDVGVQSDERIVC